MFARFYRIRSQLNALSTRLGLVSNLVKEHDKSLNASEAAILDTLDAVGILDSETTVIKCALIAIMREMAHDSPDPRMKMAKMMAFLAGAIDMIIEENEFTQDRRIAILSDVDRFVRAADMLAT